jgi:hypothetical protein
VDRNDCIFPDCMITVDGHRSCEHSCPHEPRTRRKAKRYVIVPGDGDSCPRCNQPTEIREHDAIREKHLAQPFYYTRWFCCVNQQCRTTLMMPERFKVWNGHVKAKEKADAAEQGQVVWGDTWPDGDTSGPPPWDDAVKIDQFIVTPHQAEVLQQVLDEQDAMLDRLQALHERAEKTKALLQSVLELLRKDGTQS